MGATFSGRPSAAGPRYVFRAAVTAGNGDVIALQGDGNLYEFIHYHTATYQSSPNLIDSGVASFLIASNGDVIVQEASGRRLEFLRTASGFNANTYKVF